MGQQGCDPPGNARGECVLAFSSFQRLPVVPNLPSLPPFSKSVVQNLLISTASFTYNDPGNYSGPIWTIQDTISRFLSSSHCKGPFAMSGVLSTGSRDVDLAAVELLFYSPQQAEEVSASAVAHRYRLQKISPTSGLQRSISLLQPCILGWNQPALFAQSGRNLRQTGGDSSHNDPCLFQVKGHTAF